MSTQPAHRIARAVLAATVGLALLGSGVEATSAGPAVPASRPTEAVAAPKTTNGWTTNAFAWSRIVRGRETTIRVPVTSSRARAATVVVEVRTLAEQRIIRRVYDRQFEAGVTQTLTAQWAVPSTLALGRYKVVVRVLDAGGALVHSNDADTFLVVPAHFFTLPVGATLPTDRQCALRVRLAGEVRPANRAANSTRGQSNSSDPWYARVTGNFTGTTDQIIQWASCKWGIDESIVRAQTAKESWWFQRNMGDWTTDGSRCAPGHPLGADGRPGECPESFGVQQVRYPYTQDAFPYAISSTAFNLDYALAVRRSCFEGREWWFNTVERGREYAAGDMWGCVGAWFSGRWYTPETLPYIDAVKAYRAQRIWTTLEFKAAT